MTDYKDTINLPKTDFPMRANLANREPGMLEDWAANDIYGQIRKTAMGRPRFTMPDGPPYANGAIHIGHAVNKVLKDVVIKSRTLDGYDAPYIPGWDCHGLPIELQVEKKKGKAGHKLDAREFRKACREYAMRQIDGQREDFKRLGVLGDWDNPYFTMQPQYEAAQLRAFAQIIRNGHVYKGFKPVHWCIDCGSALAEAEVEYEDKSSPGIDVRFKVIDVEDFLGRFGQDSDGSTGGPADSPADNNVPVSIPIWTTTPWTLPANQAVALHADIEYVLVQLDLGNGVERLLLAADLKDAALTRFGAASHDELARGAGALFDGVRLQHPFYDRSVPVILEDYVTLEAGTGAVHTAPGHGHEDFAAGMRHGLEVYNPVGDNGAFVEGTELFAGQNVYKANGNIIEVLADRGALLKHEPFQHSYPHCWRHKTPVIFRATPQWFVSMDDNGLRKQTLDQIPGVTWLPSWGEARIVGMVEGRPDWCISRQRTWGVPIAVFTHRETGEMHPRSNELLAAVADLVEQDGIDAWFDLDATSLLGDEAGSYEKVTDIMDVWMDSGLMHYCLGVNRDDVESPADLYLEGSDQHRGWFQSSLLTSVAMTGKAPYKAVLTHGFAVDEKGHKMSKSLGNVIAPQKVFNSLGADVLRLWVAATDYRGEINVSDEILKRMADSYRRMRNTSRYIIGNLFDFDPIKDLLPADEMLGHDAWTVQLARKLQDDLITAYRDYEFHLIYQRVHNFCVVDMGGYYLDLIKDRLYTTQKDSRARRSAQTALYHIGEAMVRWLAPILSFTAEEIWQALPGERSNSVFLHTWYEFPQVPESDGIDWQRVKQVRSEVDRELERLREADQIGSSLAAGVDLYCDGELFKKLDALGDELRFVMITSTANLKKLEDKPDAAVAAQAIDGLWISATSCEYEKCVRCWHRRADVGNDPDHPEICGRCIENVSGGGEQRLHT